MRFDNPYKATYLNFFIEPRIEPYNDKEYGYAVAFHPIVYGRSQTVLSKDELKGMADFIYETIGENNEKI